VLNIVVPLAGRGQRFADAGYELPKPLIPIHGVPMMQLVIANLRPRQPHKFHFLILREHAESHGLDRLLGHWSPGCTVTCVDAVTEGAACTVLLARSRFEGDDPLMIANCDQYVEVDIDAYVAGMGEASGLIMTMAADDPKWSFVRMDANGEVTEVVEKQVVSNEATVGIYNFRHGRDFTWAADQMIAAGRRVNGEFYVAPAYNELIRAGRRPRVYNIGSVGAGMHGIGTPADLQQFLALPLSRQAARLAA